MGTILQVLSKSNAFSSLFSTLSTLFPCIPRRTCTSSERGRYISVGRDVLEDAVKKAGRADYTVVVLGEGPYAEKPGDIPDLDLPRGQQEYVRALAATGTKVVLVLVEGRPRLLRGLPDVAHAVVNAMLPCELGGRGIADILLGTVNPSGKLPFTYPKTATDSAVPYYHRQNLKCNGGDAFGECEHEWAFGTGMSYTTFEFSNFTLAHAKASSKTLEFRVTVHNKGDVDGKETVLLFVRQPVREGNVPEAKRLVQFVKVDVPKRTAKEVVLRVTVDSLGTFGHHIGHGLKRRVEPGQYDFSFNQDRSVVSLLLHATKETVYEWAKAPVPDAAAASVRESARVAPAGVASVDGDVADL